VGRSIDDVQDTHVSWTILSPTGRLGEDSPVVGKPAL
jgi:hypothetical protein